MTRMVRRFRDVMTPEGPRFADRGLTLRQVVTLASLTLLAVPTTLVLLHLDRVADRPELLRGAGTVAGPELEAAVASEAGA